MYQGKKLVNDETNRVDTHETIRKKQLEIEEENRVRQIIKEKQEMAREKGYTIRLKEESTERNANFAKINFVRVDHFEKTKHKYQTLDNIAYKAHKDHIVEIDNHYEKLASDMENEAQQAYLRATRNEQAWLDRRHSLQK